MYETGELEPRWRAGADSHYRSAVQRGMVRGRMQRGDLKLQVEKASGS